MFTWPSNPNTSMSMTTDTTPMNTETTPMSRRAIRIAIGMNRSSMPTRTCPISTMGTATEHITGRCEICRRNVSGVRT